MLDSLKCFKVVAKEPYFIVGLVASRLADLDLLRLLAVGYAKVPFYFAFLRLAQQI